VLIYGLVSKSSRFKPLYGDFFFFFFFGKELNFLRINAPLAILRSSIQIPVFHLYDVILRTMAGVLECVAQCCYCFCSLCSL
jgi:hypothetical protein